MPESTADTFWGKGFLATALGTASPDRKKTHKGQMSGIFLFFSLRWFPQDLEEEEKSLAICNDLKDENACRI